MTVTVPSIVDRVLDENVLGENLLGEGDRSTAGLVAVILAGGAGSRWKAGGGDGHKLLAPCNGKTVVWWSVKHALDAGLDVIVVSGAIELTADLLPDNTTLVHNLRWASGQSTSLAVGLAMAAEARAHGVVVGLGDQPYVASESWQAVACAPGERPIAVAVYEGRRGQPVRLMNSVWPLLPTDGDEGARSLIRVRHDLVMEVPCEGSPQQLTDIDTPGDIDTWN